MANIPGVTLPGTYSEVITASNGVSIPGTMRIPSIMGEGSTDEVIVTSAAGNGNDGTNPTYTSTSGSDGRHFQLLNFPLISNRTTVYKNGIRLTGLEAQIDTNPFSHKYDYRIDPATGQLELQTAYIVDQGGADYDTLSTNVGDGYLNNIDLLDLNAQSETWTIRCVGVQRDVGNNPVPGTAKFLAFGSVSGTKLDSNGNPITWVANGVTVSNGIIEFAINETTPAFRDGDGFTIKVKSGALVRNDVLTANYIPEANINDPLYLEGMQPVVARHGSPSLDNNLSLGCQLAFANASPGVLTIQTAPPMPRRTAFTLTDSFKSTSTNNDDFKFPLPIGVTPDANSNIHFFVTNPVTKVESQILPNKLDYYTLGTSGYPSESAFIYDNVGAPTGYSYFYTVVSDISAINSGLDGYVARNGAYNLGVFSVPDITFDASYVGKTFKIIDATNVANNGSFDVTSVTDGKLYFNQPLFADFTNDSSVTFSIIDPATNTEVAGSDGTDGVLTNLVSTETAEVTSAAVDFGALGGAALVGKRMQISSSGGLNNGLYDITAYTTLGDKLTIRKAFVIESALRYEVFDATENSNYIVVNKNVVQNGYELRVTLIDDRDASFYDAGWINALEALEKVELDILVPLPKSTISVIFQNALAHCRTMSNIRNKKERVLFIGAIRGLTVDNLIGTSDAAVEDIGVLEGIQGDSVTEVLGGNIEDLASYSVVDAWGTPGNYRTVYHYPDEIVVSAAGENTLIDGFYMAAAHAGYLSATVRIEMPSTNKVLSGFSILRNKLLSLSQMESLAKAGVCVLQPVTGGGKIVWGITTNQSGFIEETEISIIFIRDKIAKLMRSGFSGYVGLPQESTTVAVLNTRATILLNSLVSQGLITEYKNLVVAVDATDPTQYNISVAVKPTYPINFIYIKVSIGNI